MIQAVLPQVNGPESPLVSSTATGDKAASKLVLLLFIDFCIISFNIIRRCCLLMLDCYMVLYL